MSDGSTTGRPGAATALLSWFHARERDIPWRTVTDPYRIWVAEIMAQQTRIGAMRAYYERFLERFPNVGSLASAELDEVLKVWEGLGYYARARNLHRAAGVVARDLGGQLPGDAEALRALPGIGPYTAGAIASIAFGLPEPAVDGNARRALSRLFDLERPTAKRLDRAARSLIVRRPAEAAAINQALMDLAGEICTPRRPACHRCPVAAACRALAAGTVELRPESRSRRPLPHHDVAVGVVRREDDRVLITRRPEEGLLGGLWEFPGGKIERGETARQAVIRELREELGIEVRPGHRVTTVEHAFSHFRITMYAYETEHIGGEPRPVAATDCRWVALDRLGDYAFPAASLRVIAAL